jgi:hypothetical protein
MSPYSFLAEIELRLHMLKVEIRTRYAAIEYRHHLHAPMSSSPISPSKPLGVRHFRVRRPYDENRTGCIRCSSARTVRCCLSYASRTKTVVCIAVLFHHPHLLSIHYQTAQLAIACRHLARSPSSQKVYFVPSTKR